MKFKLRKHQKKQIKLTLKALKKHDHVLFGASTGFGKSLCILDLTQKAIEAGERVLVIAPYRKLIFQLLDTFVDENPSLLMGTDSYGNVRSGNLVVASLSTLARRLNADAGYLGNIDKIIIDEAHLGFNIPNKKPTKNVKALYDIYWNKAKWIGFTATPITAGGYRLEGWDFTVFKYNTAWLIKKGWLSKFKYLSKTSIDTSGLKLQSSTGDYKVEDMEELTNTTAAVSSVIDNYLESCKGLKTLLFAVSIAHAELIHEAFAEKGISVAIIHSKIPESQQRDILEAYKNNAYDVLVNVAMLTTGFDDPEVGALIIARPIGSLRLAIQVWGRALRVHADIDRVLILDLTGVYEKVGYLPDDNFNFDRVKGASKTSDSDEVKSIEDYIYTCPSCNEVSRMIDCSRNTEITDDISVTTFYCPECNEVINETSIDLVVHEIEEIKTASDIDFTVSYNGKEVMEALGKLIKLNTRSAKTSWAMYINKTCMQKDKPRYKDAFYGYMQEVYSHRKAWKRIMDIYNG